MIGRGAEGDHRADRDAVARGPEEEERLVEREAGAGEHHEQERSSAESRPGSGIRIRVRLRVVAAREHERDDGEASAADHEPHRADRQRGGAFGAEGLRRAGRAEQQRGDEDGDDMHPSVLPFDRLRTDAQGSTHDPAGRLVR